MKGISFQAYVSAFYKQNAHKFEIIREKKIDSKYLMGILLTIKNTVLHAQQKKRQKIPFFDQTKHKNKQKNQFQAVFFA